MSCVFLSWVSWDRLFLFFLFLLPRHLFFSCRFVFGRSALFHFLKRVPNLLNPFYHRLPFRDLVAPFPVSPTSSAGIYENTNLFVWRVY